MTTSVTVRTLAHVGIGSTKSNYTKGGLMSTSLSGFNQIKEVPVERTLTSLCLIVGRLIKDSGMRIV